MQAHKYTREMTAAACATPKKSHNRRGDGFQENEERREQRRGANGEVQEASMRNVTGAGRSTSHAVRHGQDAVALSPAFDMTPHTV
jgi:hypothetical protein